MERFTWYKFFALSFLLLSHIFAAPIGNPGAPKILQKGFFIPENVWVNIRVGYEGDFIFYGPMKQSGSSFDLDKYTQFVSSGSFTLNVLERLDLYTSLGASTWDYQFRFLSPKDLAKLSCIQTPYDFIWAVGARALLYSLDRLDFGIGGRYGRSDPSINYFTVNGQDLSSSEDHITFEMWQANAGVAYHIDMFTPYVGVNYLHVHNALNFGSVIGDESSTHNSITNSIPVGMYLGCTISSGKYFFLNIEARLISEEAVSVSGDFRF